MSTFILLSHERSGSHFVGEYLALHSGLKVFDEVCNPHAVPPHEREESVFRHLHDYLARHPDLLLRHDFDRHYAWVESYFLHLSELAGQAGASHAVVDIKYGHIHRFEQHWWQSIDRPLLFWFCQWSGIRVIHLHRENVVEACVSMSISGQSQIWHSWQKGAAEKRKPQGVRVDVKQVIERCHSLVVQRNLVETWLRDVQALSMTYERVAAGLPDGPAASELSAFLGLPRTAPAEFQHARLPRTMAEVVENYDELRAACLLAGYGRFIDAA